MTRPALAEGVPGEDPEEERGGGPEEERGEGPQPTEEGEELNLAMSGLPSTWALQPPAVLSLS